MSMSEFEYYFITGQSVRTDIGMLRPVKMDEYLDAMEYLQILMLSEYEFIPMLIKELPTSYIETHKEILSAYRTIYDILRVGEGGMGTPVLRAYKELYRKSFEFFYGDGAFDKIKSREEFNMYKLLAIRSTGTPYREPNENPEIERFKRLQEARNKGKGGNITFKGMYSSLMIEMGVDSNFLNKLSIYQFYMLFERMQFLKHYEAVTPVEVALSGKQTTRWYDVNQETGVVEISSDELSRYTI